MRSRKKTPFVGFYKGKITLADGSELKRGYPVSMYPEIYAEVYRGPQAKYRVKILTGILSRAENDFVCRRADRLRRKNRIQDLRTARAQRHGDPVGNRRKRQIQR